MGTDSSASEDKKKKSSNIENRGHSSLWKFFEKTMNIFMMVSLHQWLGVYAAVGVLTTRI